MDNKKEDAQTNSPHLRVTSLRFTLINAIIPAENQLLTPLVHYKKHEINRPMVGVLHTSMYINTSI